MIKSIVAAGAGLAVLAVSGLVSAAPAPDGEAPVAIPAVAGKWESKAQAPGRNRFGGQASLQYLAPVFPRISLHLIRFECKFPGGNKIEITGLLPAQRFPQPELTLAIGARSWTGRPDALYHARSEPKRSVQPPDSMLDDNLKGEDLSWPGNPAYASLSFFRPADAQLLEAVRSGQEIRIRFEGQERVLPPVPADVAKRYSDGCAALSPPAMMAAR